MKEIKETCYKGTRILLGDAKRLLINRMTSVLRREFYTEISFPIIQFQETFMGKVGQENQHMMFNFKDRGERELCLAPEYTAVIQKLAKTTFKQESDVYLFYVQECFRGEKPQAGRYRQFTQLGVEVLNPRRASMQTIVSLAESLIRLSTNEYEVSLSVTRGLDYYKNGQGFEITCDKLGSSKQVCGGGEYDGGIGFAIGIDRLISLY